MKYRQMTEVEQQAALLALEKRRGLKVKRVDNAKLPAGSRMFYYCRLCPCESDVRNENDFSPVIHYCVECQKLLDAGWSEQEKRFIPFRVETCGTCHGEGKLYQRRNSFGRSYMHSRRCSTCNGDGQLKIVGGDANPI